MVDIPFLTKSQASRRPKWVRSSSIIRKAAWTRYVFSQDAKVIAIQYSITAMAIGMVALVLSWLMRLQLGFPGTFSFIDPNQYLQFITMHGMIMGDLSLTALFSGRFRKLPHPANGRRPRHGFPLCQHAELLGLPARSRGAVPRPFSCPAGHRRRLDRRMSSLCSPSAGGRRGCTFLAPSTQIGLLTVSNGVVFDGHDGSAGTVQLLRTVSH